MSYIMFLRKWPTEDFGTFIDYFQHHFYASDLASVYHFTKTNLLTNPLTEVPTGMTRKMFEPLSLTFFGKKDYEADLEQWFLGK